MSALGDLHAELRRYGHLDEDACEEIAAQARMIGRDLDVGIMHLPVLRGDILRLHEHLGAVSEMLTYLRGAERHPYLADAEFDPVREFGFCAESVRDACRRLDEFADMCDDIERMTAPGVLAALAPAREPLRELSALLHALVQACAHTALPEWMPHLRAQAAAEVALTPPTPPTGHTAWQWERVSALVRFPAGYGVGSDQLNAIAAAYAHRDEGYRSNRRALLVLPGWMVVLCSGAESIEIGPALEPGECEIAWELWTGGAGMPFAANMPFAAGMPFAAAAQSAREILTTA